MSKKSIRSIIALMSISLIGLIAFQAYWISYSISKEASNFDREMQQLLTDVTKNIIKHEAYVFVKSFAEVNEFKFKDLSDSESEVQVIVGTSDNDKEDKIIESKDDNTIVYNTKDGNTHIFHTTTSAKQDSSSKEIVLNRKTIKKFKSKKNLLNEVVDEIAYEFAFADLSLAKRLEGVSIDSILQNSFKKAGFDHLSYSFVLKDTDLDTVIEKGGAFLGEDPLNVYETLINKEESGRGSLMLSIPDKTAIILRSLWLTLLLSIILTGILIATFIFTINSILKQKRISQMKADFINNMTHEFKTPVATINLAIDSMLHEEVKNNPEEIERFGGIIKKENGRMNKQIESLLEMAMFDKESFQLDIQSVDAHSLLIELKENFEIKTTSQSGDIALFLDADIFVIKADRMHFYNAIRNIIDNGIKFSRESFRLKIKTSNNATHFIIKVSDQGIGMSNETQRKIFDRFYRKTKGDIHATKGFGLGLPYVKEVLQKMNAHIEVESEVGKGSCFTIKVPLQ